MMQFYLWACVVCCLVMTHVCCEVPTPPVIHHTQYYRSTIRIAAEHVAADLESAIDAIHRRSKETYTTPQGFHTQLNRYDLGYTFFIHYINERPSCLVYYLGNNTPPVPAPDYSAFRFSHKGIAAGKLLNVFVYSTGRYTTSIAFDADTGAMAVLTSHTQLVNGPVYAYAADTPIEDSVFDVPFYCDTTQAKAVSSPIEARMLSQLFRSSVVDASNYGVAESVAAEHARLTQHGSPWLYTPPQQRDVPKELDNRRYATAIRHQGACAGCWAFSVATVSEISMNYRAGTPSNKSTTAWLSAQSIIDCTHNLTDDRGLWTGARGCRGGSPLLAMLQVAQRGVAWEADYPFDGVTGERCRLLEQPRLVFPLSGGKLIAGGDVAAMMAAVAEQGAIVVVINVIPSLVMPADGEVYNDPRCTPGLAHAVTIVGYGSEGNATDYWIVRNSWGPSWGDGGYVRVRRGVNMCGIESLPFVPIAKR